MVRLVGDMSGYVDMLKRAQSETISTGKKIEGHTSMMGARAGMFMGRHLVRSLHMEILAGDVGKKVEGALSEAVMGGFMISRAMKMGQAMGGAVGGGIAGAVVGTAVAAGMVIKNLDQSAVQARQSATKLFSEMTKGAINASEAIQKIKINVMTEEFDKLQKHISFWNLDLDKWAGSIEKDIGKIVKKAEQGEAFLKRLQAFPEFKQFQMDRATERADLDINKATVQAHKKVGAIGLDPTTAAMQGRLYDFMAKNTTTYEEAQRRLAPTLRDVADAQAAWNEIQERTKDDVRAAAMLIDRYVARWNKTPAELDKARIAWEELDETLRRASFRASVKGVLDIGERAEYAAKGVGKYGVELEIHNEAAKFAIKNEWEFGRALEFVDRILRRRFEEKAEAKLFEPLEKMKAMLAFGHGGKLGEMILAKGQFKSPEELKKLINAFRPGGELESGMERLSASDALLKASDPVDRVTWQIKEMTKALDEAKSSATSMTKHWVTFGLEGGAAMEKWGKWLKLNKQQMDQIFASGKIADRDAAGKLIESVRNPLDKFEEKFKHLQVLFNQGWFGKGAEGAAVFETVVKKVKDQMLGKEPEYKSPTAVSAQGAGGRAFLSDYLENFRRKETTNVEGLLKRIAVAVEKENPPVVIKEAAI